MRSIIASIVSTAIIWLVLSLLFGHSYPQGVAFIHFDEYMDTIGMSNPNNFQWDNDMITLSAELIDTSTVKLFVSDPIINLWYLVEVFNVFDLAGNIVNPEKDTASVIWSAVPVELISFTAKIIPTESGYNILLEWETATEINNYGFEVERDKETMGFIEGNGNSNSPKKYTFTDNTAPHGKHTYRLKQIDINGTYEYSVEISVTVKVTPLFRIYPNPTSRQFCVTIYPLIEGKKVELYSSIGELVKTYEMPDNKLYISETLASGVYIIRYNNKAIKLMIKK